MKRFLLITVLSGISFCNLFAQSLTVDDFDEFENVKEYYDGAISIARATVADRPVKQYHYEDAINYLRPASSKYKWLVQRYSALELEEVDTKAIGSIEGHILYTYDYARKHYADVNFQENGLLRNDDEDIDAETKRRLRCRVKILAIAPLSSVVYKDVVTGRSILVAVAEPNATLRLSVSGKSKYACESYENGMVGFCKWVAGENEETIYRIENTGDKEVCLALIAN